MLLDRDLSILWANRATAEAVGAAPERLEGRCCHEAWHRRATPCGTCPVSRSFASGRPLAEILKGEDGRTWDVRTVPLPDASGRVESVIALKRDITEHARLEAQYLHAQKMESIGTLAGGVAHDFNNILQVILGSLEVLQMDLAPANPIREELRPIEEAARRASELVRQLLAFGRKEPADPRPLDLNALAEALQRLLRRVVRKDIVLELRLDPRTPSVRGDYLQIEQALMNLCVNAQDALEGRGGTIRIETGRVEGPERAERARDDPRFAEAEAWAVLTVRDDGPGVPEAIRERIFEPFFSAREGGRGTGLGLATAYWVARQHRGFATLDPQESGAAFSLYLPLSG